MSGQRQAYFYDRITTRKNRVDVMKITHHARNLEYYEIEGVVLKDELALVQWLKDNPGFSILACDLSDGDDGEPHFSVMTTTREVESA